MDYNVEFEDLQNGFDVEVNNLIVVGTPPTLFTPSLDINLGSGVLTITDGNGSFATYVIEVKGENSSYTIETKSKSILLENEGITHNEKQTISVKAKGSKFFDSESVSVFWDFIDGTQGLAYTLNADGLGYTCSGIGTANLATDNGKLVIPSEYMGLPVTAVGNNAFNGNTTIKELIIKDGINTIGERAFSGTKITKLSLTPSITVLNYGAFSGCGITDLQFVEGLQRIETRAFMNIKIEKLVLPKSITFLNEWSFALCSNLKEVVFNSKPRLVGETFPSCTNINSIKVTWSEGEVGGAPWGAVNATITYNYTEGE